MKHVQFSISSKIIHPVDYNAGNYRFFFRTEWMEPDEGLLVLEELKKSFPFPRWQITVYERETTTTYQELT